MHRFNTILNRREKERDSEREENESMCMCMCGRRNTEKEKDYFLGIQRCLHRINFSRRISEMIGEYSFSCFNFGKNYFKFVVVV